MTKKFALFLPKLRLFFVLLVAVNIAKTFASVTSVIDLKTKINRLAFTHKNNSVNLYVTSTNHLYRLFDSYSENLQIKVDIVTGPKSQKQQCAFLTSSSSKDQCIKYICDEDSERSKILNTMTNRQQSQMVDNENRLLLIDDANTQIIECGSIDYGGCRLRGLNDLEIIGCNYSAPLIPFSTASGVIVSSSQKKEASSLYLMVSMETDQSNSERLEKSEFPVFSLRNLDSSIKKSQLFQLKYPIEYMNYDQTLFDSDFHMKVKYSFKHNGYIYFLYTITNKILTQSCNSIVTQQANSQTDSIIVTRMVRICDTSWPGDQASSSTNKRNNHQENMQQLNDRFSQTATNLAVLAEVIIDCEDSNGLRYHLLQSADFLDEKNNATLFMTFNTTSGKSAVCSLGLNKLENHYSTMLRKCMDGDNSYAELVSPYSNKATWKAPCRCSMITDLWRNIEPFDRGNDRKLFCHNDYFNYLNGRLPLTLNSIDIYETSNVKFTKTVTSITTVPSDITQNSPLVIILSTLDAKVIMASYDRKTGIANVYDQVDLLKSQKHRYTHQSTKSSALDIQMLIADDYQLTSTNQDHKQRTLYATYDQFIFKIDLQECSKFTTCNSCLGKASNPFCGWCVNSDKCTSRHTCEKSSCQLLAASKVSTQFSSLWLSKGSFNSECPRVLSTYPSEYLNPSILYTNKNEFIKFEINLGLFPDELEYFCEVSVNFNQFSEKPMPNYYTKLDGVKAHISANNNNKSFVECNLVQIKKKLQKFIGQVPIENKFANLTIEIRANSNRKANSLSSLVTQGKLFAFNCSYLQQCEQCLNPKLNSGCVWCAKSSKCIFNKQLKGTVSLFSADYENNECPNEVEFFRESNSGLCTSYSLKPESNVQLKIPLTADSHMNKFTEMSIENRQVNYQLNFKCVFTCYDRIESNTEIFTSKVEWLGTGNFDCVFSPYKMKCIDSHVALQNAYMSVWWSSDAQGTEGLQMNGLDSLIEWNQVKLLSSVSKVTDEELFFQNDTLANKKNFIQVDVLSCSMKASSCGECMEEELVKLGCGWCKSSKSCSMEKDCVSNWMNDLTNNYCADPTITLMSPICGPRQNAGTQLIIKGQNLGVSPSEISVKFKSINSNAHHDLECPLIDDLYVKSSKVVCRTKPIKQLTQSQADRYLVYVQTNKNNPQAIYSSLNDSQKFFYEFITPNVTEVEPQRGIRAGGTLLKITGNHLNCGSSVKFLMSGGICSIVNITQTAENDIVHCITPKYISTAKMNLWNKQINSRLKNQKSAIQMKMDDYEVVLDEAKFNFEYVNDPKVLEIKPDRTIVSGGLLMIINGQDFKNIQTASLVLSEVNSNNDKDNNQTQFSATCSIKSSATIECLLPTINENKMNTDLTSRAAEYAINIQFNQNKIEHDGSAADFAIHVYPDPIFKESQVFTDKTRIILIEGDHFLLGVVESDYDVLIGESSRCNITSITMNLIACILPDLNEINKDTRKITGNNSRVTRELKSNTNSNTFDVRVQVGRSFIRSIGKLRLEADSKYKDSVQIKYILFVASIVSIFLFSTMVSCFVILKRRQNKQIRQLKRMQTEFENLEMRVARECKEAFTELQMDIGEITNTLNQTGAPFHDFQTYCMKILLPNASENEKYCMTTSIDLRLSTSNKDNVQKGVAMFSQLILNKNFLLTFIHTLESDSNNFFMQDRVNLASYISICLHDHMDYFTDVLFSLLSELIQKTIDSKNNPKILLRRNESVAEKMLTNWFAFLLFDFIHNCAGTPLYILFLSIKQQIYKGPVDAITCEARYSLSEDKLIRQSIDYDPIVIRVQLQDFEGMKNQELIVKVLTCDTVTQTKEKILDAFYKGYPFSKRPSVEDLDLVFISSEFGKSNHGRLILHDEDKTCKIDSDDSKRTNTLSHYKVTNGSLLVLITRQSYQIINSNDGLNSYSILDNVNSKNAENMTLLSKSSKGSSSPPTYSKLSTGGLNEFTNGIYSTMNGSSVGLTEHALLNNTNSSRNKNYTLNIHKNSLSGITTNPNKLKKYHLIKTNDNYNSTTPNVKDDKSPKLVSEVYLTRLLATKGGMQSYVDDFFETVFSTAHGSNVLPYAIKYLFDFLDEQAMMHGITDPDVVYTWKSNSLPLRFWVNIIKNPDFVFDIHKSNIVDASLSVIASTFMDSCSQSRLDLNKESPSGKLLFYKEVHKYRKWVQSYYSEIKQMPRINEQDLGEMLNEETRKRPCQFNKNNALYKLYNDYVKKYRTKIENALNNDGLEPNIISINKHLNYRLQQVIYLMDAIEV